MKASRIIAYVFVVIMAGSSEFAESVKTNNRLSDKPTPENINQSNEKNENIDMNNIEDNQNVDPFLRSNYFYETYNLYQSLNSKGFIQFEKNKFSGSAGMIFNTEGVFIKDPDLNSKSTFADKQLILNNILNFVFKVNYQNWLETVIVIYNNSYLGSKDKNVNYQQSSQQSITENNPVFLTSLSFVRIHFINLQKMNLSLSLGEQFLKYDYLSNDLFSDYIYPLKINGLLMMAENDDIGKFKFLLADVLNLYENWIEPPSRYKHLQTNNTDIIGNYNGDILSFRSGIFYESPDILKKLNVVKWHFYINTLFTRYGPVASGADRSNKSGSFTDNDYLFHNGLGMYFNFAKFAAFFEVCRSDGIDRKLPDIFGNNEDIKINGYFFRADIFLQLPPFKNIHHFTRINILYSDGPSFDSYGNKRSYGFVASGNHDFGGFLINNIWGFRPYAVSLNDGVVNHQSYGFYHTSGVLTFNFGYSVFLSKTINVEIQSWLIYDSSFYNDSHSIFKKNNTFPDFKNRNIGNDNMVSVFFTFNSVLQLYFSLDMFIPAEAYRYFNHGIYNEKKDTFYGVSAGMRIQF
ncbi:MAG: hypothetical protein OEV78_00605 [Spirochaetia bacterium]|nr:hypothetical protein [Spirochaetia bacterium]